MVTPVAYYNEFDPFAAEWLRELIAAGHIAYGDVDTRDIRDVRPDDLRPYTQCHFFAGIGVWSYALRRAGWPDSRQVWTGSCPCQPFSAAGGRSGFIDERHLWPAFFHLIGERRPGVVFGEQVASKDGLAWLDLVQADLEGAGYANAALDLCAAGFGAPHIRQRLFFVGHANGAGREARDALTIGAGARPGEPPQSSLHGVGELAYSNGRHASAERKQPGGQQRQFAEDGCAVQLGDASSKREVSLAGVREGPQPELNGACAAGELGDASGARLQERERNDRVQREALGALPREAVECRGDLSSMEHAESEQVGVSGRARLEGSATSGFWHDAEWIECTDGKARPVEPGTFPLAHGAPARVGRLRGYGNAINAEAATGFVAAAMQEL